MLILETLEQGRGFTQTDRVLADYVLAHPNEVVRMSAADLAAATYTSTGAVTRLCKRIGCKGFKDFRIGLNTEVERRRSTLNVGADVRLSTGQSTVKTIADLSNVYEKAVADTSAAISPLELHEVARSILNAERVIMFGVGDSAVACSQFANDLLRIGITPVDAMNNHMLWPYAALAGKGDVGLFVSYKGYWFDELADHMELIRRAGGKVILVSSIELPLGLASRCDHYLKLPLGEDILASIGTMYSRVCMQYLLSCLYATAYSLDNERNEQARDVAVDQWRHDPHIGLIPTRRAGGNEPPR